jgi:hypothetical protein
VFGSEVERSDGWRCFESLQLRKKLKPGEKRQNDTIKGHTSTQLLQISVAFYMTVRSA